MLRHPGACLIKTRDDNYFKEKIPKISKAFSIEAIVSYASNLTNLRTNQNGCVFNTHVIDFLCVFRHFNRVKDADTQLIWGTA